MKIRKMLFVIMAMLSIFTLASCDKEQKYDGKVKVTYMLEGGTFQNCQTPVVQYYDYKENGKNLIIAPDVLAKKELSRAGYTLEGWFLNKEEANGKVTYSNVWDFTTNEINNEDLTLYAKWVKDIRYSYIVCYKDELTSEVKELGTYFVDEGEKFEDYAHYANKRLNYTPIGFMDEAGNPWDNNFTHPGGEQSTAVRVFTNYIEGKFELVYTSSDLIKAKNKNIYLMSDIDMEGKEFNFGNYKGKFFGNNHTISNITVRYDGTKNGLIEDFNDSSLRALSISLFGNIVNAEIKDVTFANIKVDVKTTLGLVNKIYVAPIAGSMENSKISNVKVTGSVTSSKLPEGFLMENLIIVVDKTYYKKDESSTETNVTVEIENLIK